MRILAIRGENLASLAGAFEIRFDEGRLASAGVYAITGATGAGKSTILDAMCLALFGQTPRLQGRGGARLAGDQDDKKEALTQDPRQLLRRGSGWGFAEVEFIGQDSRRYRSRWEVQRANKKSDGRLQPARRTFEEVDGRSTASARNSEVANLVVDRLGLDFDQFRRSVLLAQGEFAAFLRASSNDKALLLEQMTDTSLYAEVSMLAHGRGRDSQVLLERLTSEMDAVICLDAQARLALELEREQLRSALARLADEDRSVRRHLEWYAVDARLADDVAAAAKSLDSARSALESAAPRRRRVELALRVGAEFGETHRELVDLDARGRAASMDLERLRGELRTSLLDRDASRAAVSAAAASAEQAVAARRAAEAELRLAREVDLELRRTEETKNAALADATRAEAARLGADRVVEQARAAHASAVAARDRCDAVLAVCAADAGWAESHGALDQRLEGLERQRRELVEHGLRRQGFVRRASSRERAIRRLEAVSLRRETRWAELRSAFEAARRGRESLDPSALATRRQESVLRSETLRRIDDLFSERDALVEAVLSCEAALAAARESGSRHRTAVERASADVAELQIAVDRRRRAEREATNAASAARLRNLLVSGEPCLVCGSREHPGVHEETAMGAIEELARAVLSAEAELERGREVFRSTEISLAKAVTEVSNLEKERARCAMSLDSLHRRITSLLSGISSVGAGDLACESPRGSLRTLSDSIEADLRSIDEGLRRVSSLESEMERLRSGVDDAHTACRAASEKKARWEVELEAVRDAIRDIDATVADRERERATTIEQVLAVLSNADDRREVELDVATLRRRLETRAAAWRRAGRDRQAAAEALAKTSGPLEAAVLESRLRTDSEREAKERVARAAEAHSAAMLRRQSILGGRAAEVVEAELERDVLKTAAERDAAMAKSTVIEDACAKLSGALERVAHEVARIDADRDVKRVELERAVAASGLDPSLVAQALAEDPRLLEAEKAALHEIDTQFRSAVVREEERRRSRDRHRESSPEASQPACTQRLAAITDEIAARRERESELSASLGKDDGAREQRRLLEARREEAARDAGVWARLAELIGSHDGKKLRVFAQGLTLDVLVRETNRRLSELAPRYHLQRIRGADLELAVIDRDMGDDVRGVESLSGGETFLVSLALALGLSSLAGRRARIESLFIDEGFGTLDAQTLDQALSVLDALQSTGTQVGVISHVGGLAERLGVAIAVERRGPGTSAVRCP